MVAGQRRHRHRRAVESFQRIRLPQAPGPFRRSHAARAKPVPPRIWTGVRRRGTVRFDHAGRSGRHRSRSRDLCAKGCELSSLPRQLRQCRGPAARCGGRVGRRVRRLRRRRPRHGRHDVEWRPAHRPHRQLRHRHAERPARAERDGRSVRSRTVRARSRDAHPGSADEGRRHVLGPVRRSVAWLRPGARRVRLHLHGAAWSGRRTDDIRRQGHERSLRPARRLSSADPGRDRRAEVRAGVLGRPAGHPCRGITDRARVRHGAPPRSRTRSSWSDRPATRADFELDGPRRSVRGRLHGRRENGVAASGRAHKRGHVFRGHRPRVLATAGDLRSQWACASHDAGAQSARDSRGTRARRRARRGPRPRAASRHPRRLQGQHRRRRVADDRWIARAHRSSPAPGLTDGRRDAPRRRDRDGQGKPRRVSIRRLRDQHGRRHCRECLRRLAQHVWIEWRKRVGRVGQSRDPGVWHRHVQLALESSRLRVARDDTHDARVDEPRGGHAAQHVQRCRWTDRQVRARACAGARPGRRRGSGGRGHRGRGRPRQRVVYDGARPRGSQRRANWRAAPALHRLHRRTRGRGPDGVGDRRPSRGGSHGC